MLSRNDLGGQRAHINNQGIRCPKSSNTKRDDHLILRFHGFGMIHGCMDPWIPGCMDPCRRRLNVAAQETIFLLLVEFALLCSYKPWILFMIYQ